MEPSLSKPIERKPVRKRKKSKDSNWVKIVLISIAIIYLSLLLFVPLIAIFIKKVYYIKIIAKDSSAQNNAKVVSAWGDGSEPIQVYTAGELISVCNSPKESPAVTPENDKEELAGQQQGNAAALVGTQNIDETQNVQPNEKLPLRIATVMNENYLQPGKKVQTIISWETNRPATTMLIYAERNSTEKKEMLVSDKMQTKHAAILTTLKVATTYYFHVKSVDENGNVAVSEEYSLRTPKPQSTVIDQIATAFKTIFQQIKPN